MVTSYTRPMGPYDTAFEVQSGRLGEAREKAESAPLDYSRLGGRVLGQRGDMLASFAKAAQNVSQDRRSADMNRTIAWDKARIKKQALVDKLKAENISSLVSTGGKFAQDLARRNVDIATREMDVHDIGSMYGFDPTTQGGRAQEQIEKLLEEGRIRETADGSGRYRFTAINPIEERFESGPLAGFLKPRSASGIAQEFHRGPFWWESPTSTGGWTR